MGRRRPIPRRRIGARLTLAAVSFAVGLAALIGAVSAASGAEVPVEARGVSAAPVSAALASSDIGPVHLGDPARPVAGAARCGDLAVAAISCMREPTTDAGGLCGLSIYVVARNLGDRPLTVTPLDLRLRDAEGRTYEAVSDRRVSSGAFPAAVVRPGESVSGWRAFEVSGDAFGLRLVVDNDDGVEAVLDLPASGSPVEPDPTAFVKATAP